MRPAKMQLKEYFVAESFFRAQTKYFEHSSQEDFRLNPSDLKIEVALGQREETANEKICELYIELEDETEQSFPYVFKMVLLGFFTLDESCDENEADLLLRVNAPAVLYSAAREFLLLTTGRSLFAPLMLPTVTFLPIVEESNIVAEKTEHKPAKRKAEKPTVTKIKKLKKES